MIRNLFRSNKVNPSVTPEIVEKKAPKSFRENADRQSILLGTTVDSKSRVRLGIEKHLFSRTGVSAPILEAGTADNFHNLQIRGKVFEGNDVVLEDSVTGMPVAIAVRKYATAGNTFKIYSLRPVYTGQSPANIFKYNQRLYPYAEVKRRGKVLTVVLEGRSGPTYTIHKVVSHPSRKFPTKHVIRKHGSKVASTSSGGGNSFILTVDAGADPCLMICLAAIAEEADK